MIDVNETRVSKSVAGAKHFVEIPSWYEICPPEYVYSNGKNQKWNKYWAGRRDGYLASVEKSIANYNGEDLYKSYDSIRRKEFRLNDDYKIEREHTWQQERREEIYNYTKDIVKTAVAGAYLVKTAPQTVNVNHSGTINQNVNFRGTIGTYNHYYFH